MLREFLSELKSNLKINGPAMALFLAQTKIACVQTSPISFVARGKGTSA